MQKYLDAALIGRVLLTESVDAYDKTARQVEEIIQNRVQLHFWEQA